MKREGREVDDETRGVESWEGEGGIREGMDKEGLIRKDNAAETEVRVCVCVCFSLSLSCV